MSKQQGELALPPGGSGAGSAPEWCGHHFATVEDALQYFADEFSDFVRTQGFDPKTSGAILRTSEPPFAATCANPFLDIFAGKTESEDVDSEPAAHRAPLPIDSAYGKSDSLYQAHTYHTKVPPSAILPFILHYTEPGEIVLDGFCGSGMTGVAAILCGQAGEEMKERIVQDRRALGLEAPRWGKRRAILGDLSPAATFIAAGYCLPWDPETFISDANDMFSSLEAELGWMYETKHPASGMPARIEYTVWSEVFRCDNCSGEIVFWTEALDEASGKVRSRFPCPHCHSEVSKRSLEASRTKLFDNALGEPREAVDFRPVLIRGTVDGQSFEKSPDSDDLELLTRLGSLPVPSELPLDRLPLEEMYHGSRLGPKGIEYVHDMFLPRARHALAFMWRYAQNIGEQQRRHRLLFLVEQAIWTSSILNRYQPAGFKQVNKYLPGVYYVPSQQTEVSPWYALEARSQRLRRVFTDFRATPGDAIITTGDCADLALDDQSVDYVFTDPPFGENIPYADLNFLVESWHGHFTRPASEAIIDSKRGKGLTEYQELMRKCFEEYYRVLKPGRWMTVVFSNSKNAIWRAIQEALGTAGFVVADVRSLDKKQGSYRQVTSSAVKQDLVIAAYKPSARLQDEFKLGQATAEGAWSFITEHLSNVPVFVGRGNEVESVAERAPQMLLDRMIAFHVQRGMAVPMDSKEFLEGLGQRYPERDGMYFLPDQVADYDRKRARAEKLRQLELFVSDEASAIQWVRQQLTQKPQSFQDLQPQFMKELQAWAKHEQTVELQEILEQNFLLYEGQGPVPSQIHSYLSTQYKTLRGLEKDDPGLVDKAEGRWYVPDPGKAGDLEKLRERALLREFETYKSSKKKLKQFRTEAIRAGFKAAYDANDYDTIVSVAEKIPDSVLQEDEKLLMYYDVALMRRG